MAFLVQIKGKRIAKNQINEEHLIDASVTTDKIGELAVTGAKVQESTLGESKFDAATRAKLNNSLSRKSNADRAPGPNDDAENTSEVAWNQHLNQFAMDGSIWEHKLDGMPSVWYRCEDPTVGDAKWVEVGALNADDVSDFVTKSGNNIITGNNTLDGGTTTIKDLVADTTNLTENVTGDGKLLLTNEERSKIAALPETVVSGVGRSTYSGDGVQTVFNFPQKAFIKPELNGVGVFQDVTIDTINGTITFAEAPAAADVAAETPADSIIIYWFAMTELFVPK